jgi:tetratricopeptide (TPR) repeat protein
LHAVILRGLSLGRDARYASMDALLEALDDDPLARRKRRLRWLTAAAAAAALVATGVVLLNPNPSSRCKAAGDKLAQVWGDRHRRAVRAAHGPHVVAALDRYGAALARERVAACEATFVEGGQSEQLMDRRMRCLDRRLGRMGALIDRLRAGKPGGGAGAASGRGEGGGRRRRPRRAVAEAPNIIDAVAALPGLAECRDRDALSELTPPPEGARPTIQAVLELIHRAEAHRSLGEFDEGLALAQKALARATPTNYAPIIGRAHYVLGFLAGRAGDHAGAEKHLRDAIRRAAAAKAHYLEAISWLSLIYHTGHGASRPDQALAMAPAAEAAVARAAGDATLKGRLEGNLGLILMTKGDYKGALARLERSLSVFEKARGPDDLDTAVAANNLAMLLERLGRHKEAYAHLERVLRVRERAMGKDHPSVATVLNDMGNTAHSLGELERAEKQLTRALAIRERALGDGHIRTAHTLNNLAIVLGDMNRYEEAARHARRAVAIAERAAGKNSVELAGPLNTLGNQLRDLGKQKEAWEAYARGLAIVEWARGKDHISAAPMLENLARIMVKLGLHDRALQFIDRALAMRVRVQGAAHPMTVNALALRGSFNLDAKRPEAAADDFAKQLIVVTRAHGAQHVEVALANYNLAVALEQGGKLGEAAERYRAALAIFERVAPRHRFVASGWRGLGDVAVARRDLGAAQAHYEKAVAAAAASKHSGLADMLHELGRVQGKLRRWGDAVKTFEQAVKVRKSGDPALHALAKFELARALWSEGKSRPRALALAREARGLFVSAGARAEDNVKEVDGWLRGRRR